MVSKFSCFNFDLILRPELCILHSCLISSIPTANVVCIDNNCMCKLTRDIGTKIVSAVGADCHTCLELFCWVAATAKLCRHSKHFLLVSHNQQILVVANILRISTFEYTTVSGTTQSPRIITSATFRQQQQTNHDNNGYQTSCN